MSGPPPGATGPQPGAMGPALKELDILFACDLAFLIATLVSFSARVYVRTRMLGRFAVDDWAMFVAVVFFSVHCAVGIALSSVQHRLFALGETTSLGTILILVRLVNTFYVLTIIAVKISLGFFFLSIFTVNQKVQRYCIYAMAALSTISGIVVVVMIESTCGIEIGFQENCSISHAFNIISMSWSVLNAITDLLLSGLSLAALWPAKLKLHVKICAAVLLCMATFGGSISIVRIAVTVGLTTDDTTLQTMQIGRWSAVEAGVYITTGCLATLRPLLRVVWKYVSGSDTTTVDSRPTYLGTSASAKQGNIKCIRTYEVNTHFKNGGAISVDGDEIPLTSVFDRSTV